MPGTIFSVVDWYMALCKHTGKRLDKAAPLFLAKDKQRPYTYRCAMSDLHRMLDVVGCTERYGLHGLRVLGYNTLVPLPSRHTPLIFLRKTSQKFVGDIEGSLWGSQGLNLTPAPWPDSKLVRSTALE